MPDRILSSFLIGSRGSNSPRLSRFLIGNIRDKDKDGFPAGFSKWVDDCNDKNKSKDGWLSDVGRAISNAGVAIGDIIKGTPNYGRVGYEESPTASQNVPTVPSGGVQTLVPTSGGGTTIVTTYPSAPSELKGGGTSSSGGGTSTWQPSQPQTPIFQPPTSSSLSPQQQAIEDFQKRIKESQEKASQQSKSIASKQDIEVYKLNREYEQSVSSEWDKFNEKYRGLTKDMWGRDTGRWLGTEQEYQQYLKDYEKTKSKTESAYEKYQQEFNTARYDTSKLSNAKVYSFSALNKKYADLIKDNQFIGNAGEYEQYLRDFKSAQEYSTNQVKFGLSNKLSPREAFEVMVQQQQDKALAIQQMKESKEYNTQLQVYKQAGYTSKEAEALAVYSYQSQSTPTPTTARDYLTYQAPSERTGISATIFGKEGIAPQGKMKQAEFYAEKGLTRGSAGVFNTIAGIINVPFEKIGQGQESEYSYVVSPTFPGFIGVQPKIIKKYAPVGYEVSTFKATPGEAITSSGLMIGAALSAPVAIGAGLIYGAGSVGRTAGGLLASQELGINPVTYYGQAFVRNPLQVGMDTALIVGGAYGLGRVGYKWGTKPRIYQKEVLVSPSIEKAQGVISKPIEAKSYVNAQGQRVYVEKRNFVGVGQQWQPGRITTITNRFRQLIRANPIYEGIPYESPTITASSLRANYLIQRETSYQKALKYLIKSGYSESQARQVLRYTKPKLSNVQITGKVVTKVTGEENPITTLTGIRKIKAVQREAEQGIFTAGKQGQIEFIEVRGQPIISKGEIPLTRSIETAKRSYLTSEGSAYSKVREAGKTIKITQSVTGAKLVKETPRFSVYEQAELSQQLIPRRFKVSSGRARISIEKGEPVLSVTDESILRSTGFTPSKAPKPRPIQLAKTEEALATSLISTLTKPVIPKPKITIIEPTISPGISSSVYARSQYGIPISIREVQETPPTPTGRKGAFTFEETTAMPVSGAFSPSAIGVYGVGGQEQKDLVNISFGALTGLGIGTSTGIFDRTDESQNALSLSGVAQIPKQAQATAQVTRQEQVTLTLPRVIFPGEPTPRNPTPIKPVEPFKIEPDLDNRKKKKKSGQAYDALVLIDATKGNKARWVQVADNVSREAALGFGARFTDQSNISSQFKIVKDEGQVNDIQNNFWVNLGYKFRDYMVRKGNKIQNQNRYIEKRKYRLDSPRERGQIQQARASTLLMGAR